MQFFLLALWWDLLSPLILSLMQLSCYSWTNSNISATDSSLDLVGSVKTELMAVILKVSSSLGAHNEKVQILKNYLCMLFRVCLLSSFKPFFTANLGRKSFPPKFSIAEYSYLLDWADWDWCVVKRIRVNRILKSRETNWTTEGQWRLAPLSRSVFSLILQSEIKLVQNV